MQGMIIKADSSDVSLFVEMIDALTGQPATGLTIADMSVQATRAGTAAGAAQALTALAGVDSAHADNYAIEVDATDQPGVYRIDISDAVSAGGTPRAVVSVTHANCRPAHVVLELWEKLPADGYLDLSQANTTETSASTVGGQLRRTHALAGGTVTTRDMDTPEETIARDETDAADLVTETTSITGNVITVTPS